MDTEGVVVQGALVQVTLRLSEEETRVVDAAVVVFDREGDSLCNNTDVVVSRFFKLTPALELLPVPETTVFFTRAI